MGYLLKLTALATIVISNWSSELRAQTEPRVDLYGDPLPAGAIARAGSVRFRPGDRIEQVVWSPSGQEIASWGEGIFCLWDATTGKLLEQHRFPNARMMVLHYFSNMHSLALLQSREGQLHFWDFAGGQAPPDIQPGPEGGVIVAGVDDERFTQFAVSPDGQWLAAATIGYQDRARKIRLWRYEVGKPLHELQTERDFPRALNRIDWIRFTDDGSRLVAIGERDEADELKFPNTIHHAAEVIVWDVDSGEQLIRFDAFHVNAQGYYRAAAVSPMGSLLVLGAPDKSLRVFDLESGKQRTKIECDQNVHSLTFLSNSRVVAGGWKGTLGVFDISNRSDPILLDGHNSFIESVAVSADGRQIASAGQDKIIRLWDVATCQQISPSFPGHQYYSLAIDSSEDGEWFVTGGWDGKLCYWETASGILSREHELDGYVASIALTPDEQKIAVGLNLTEKTLKLLDVFSGEEHMSFDGHDQVGHNSLAISADGRWLVAGESERPRARVWDLKTGRLQTTFEFSQAAGKGAIGPRVNCVAISPDCKTAALGSSSNLAGSHFVRGWDMHTGDALEATASPRGSVLSMAFLSKGRELVTGGDSSQRWFTAEGEDLSSPDFQHSVQIWLVETGESVSKFSGEATDSHGRSRSVNDIAVSPDSGLIATAEQNGTIEIYDVRREIGLATLRHSEEAYAVTFTKDGRHLITLGSDLCALVWDLDEVLGR